VDIAQNWSAAVLLTSIRESHKSKAKPKYLNLKAKHKAMYLPSKANAKAKHQTYGDIES